MKQFLEGAEHTEFVSAQITTPVSQDPYTRSKIVKLRLFDGVEVSTIDRELKAKRLANADFSKQKRAYEQIIEACQHILSEIREFETIGWGPRSENEETEER